MSIIYIRKECIEHEYRTPIVPSDIPILLKENYKIYIESSENRCYPDSEYEKYGAIVVTDEWYNYNGIVVGLKQLQHDYCLNRHVHMYFAHCYKGQPDAKQILTKFKYSNSILYDLEYFTYPNNKRFLAFGFYAGVAGCILAIQKYLNELTTLQYWKNSNLMISDLMLKLNNKKPSIAVIGYKGRCGTGVCSVLNRLGLEYTGYTSKHVISNLENFDIVLNCILLSNYIKPWFTKHTEFKKPIIICDISCDPTNPNNPIAIYNQETTWDNPVYQYNDYVSIIAISNLPSLLPFESSDDFSKKIVELFLLKKYDTDKIWLRNLKFYDNYVKDIKDI